MKLGSLVIVENDAYTRSLLTTSLKTLGFEILASTESAQEALSPFNQGRVDVALLDLDLGSGPNGKDIAYKMREKQKDIGLILITSFSDHRAAGDAWRSLPLGMRHLTKSTLTDLNQLVRAILETKARPLEKSSQNKSSQSSLTDNQIEVLRFINMGLSNQEIARRLDISVSAVEKTISRMNHLLGFENDTSLNARISLVRYFAKIAGRSSD